MRLRYAFCRHSLEQHTQYGIEQLQYMHEAANDRNLYKKGLHPIWQDLTAALGNEYIIDTTMVRTHSVEYRYMMARKYVLSYYALQANNYSDIPLEIIQAFKISEEEFNQVKINSVWDLQN